MYNIKQDYNLTIILREVHRSNLGSLKSQIQWRAPINCPKQREDRKRVGTLASLPIFDCGVTMSSSTIYYRSEVKLGKSLAFIL